MRKASKFYSIKETKVFHEDFLQTWCYMNPARDRFIQHPDGTRVDYNRIYIAVKDEGLLCADYIEAIYECLEQDGVLGGGVLNAMSGRVIVPNDDDNEGEPPADGIARLVYYAPYTLMGDPVCRHCRIISTDASEYLKKN